MTNRVNSRTSDSIVLPSEQPPTHARRIDKILSRLEQVAVSGTGWSAACPAHDDEHPSLSVSLGEDERVLLHCHAGCSIEDVLSALDLSPADLVPRKEEGSIPADSDATLQHPPAGTTLAQYAEAKRLPVEFLRELGLTDVTHQDAPAIRIPFFNQDSIEQAVRFRTALTGQNRFRWKNGAKPMLYGLWRLEEARKSDSVVLVEGESDTQTLWHHGIPALGLPSAPGWNDDRDAAYLEGIERIYVVVEPDQGGEQVRRALADSRIRERVRLVSLDEHKDVSGLYLDNPDRFEERLQHALAASVAWPEVEDAEREQRRREAFQACRALAHEPRILDPLTDALLSAGLVGEEQAAKLLYLALASRLLDRPVSIAVKGPSSGGKSFTVEQVLRFFPDEAYYALSAMSERALAYSDEPLSHRHLVIYEATGMEGEIQTYMIRSLLSEGRIRYETVEKTAEGMKARLIEREGPTGLIVTTTAVSLHPENETRLLSLTISDSPEQTREILRALADDKRASNVDMAPWHALQEWLATGDNRVTVPYARELADLIPPLAPRLRRDFTTVLTLIKAHALLHQANRERHEQGEIVATLDDYAIVRELVLDLIGESVQATVPPAIRETVTAVERLQTDTGPTPLPPVGISVTNLAKELGLDKSTVSRRVKVAERDRYLENLEQQKGRPARLIPGEPLPAEQELLPPVSALDGTHARPTSAAATPVTAHRRDEVNGEPPAHEAQPPSSRQDTPF